MTLFWDVIFTVKAVTIEVFHFRDLYRARDKIPGINYRLSSSKWFKPDLKIDGSILCQATQYYIKLFAYALNQFEVLL